MTATDDIFCILVGKFSFTSTRCSLNVEDSTLSFLQSLQFLLNYTDFCTSPNCVVSHSGGENNHLWNFPFLQLDIEIEPKTKTEHQRTEDQGELGIGIVTKKFAYTLWHSELY